MSVINFRKIIVASASLLFVGSAARAACTNATLTGAFGFQEQGQAIGAGFSEFRSVGEFNFDGAEKGTRQSTIWYSTFQVVAEGKNGITYTVNPDCTFSLTYVPSGETFTGVLVAGGQRLLYLETTGDPMRSGQADRLRSYP